MKNTTGSLGFNGQDNSDKPGGYSKKFQTNQTGKTMKENYGVGPRVAGTTGKSTGVATAKAAVTGHAKVPKCSESINVGRGPTKGNMGSCC